MLKEYCENVSRVALPTVVRFQVSDVFAPVKGLLGAWCVSVACRRVIDYSLPTCDVVARGLLADQSFI